MHKIDFLKLLMNKKKGAIFKANSKKYAEIDLFTNKRHV